MKIITLFLLLVPTLSFSQTMNDRVLAAINEMPKAGGYVLSAVSPTKLRDSFSWNVDQLLINEKTAIPSYCTTATYIVFYKALKSYWDEVGYPSRQVLELLKANVEYDGVRIWGRWNSNGPGTAKFFFDTALGANFTDISQARAGDFLKIYWNTEIGKNEKAHSVVFLKADAKTLTFWSSNKDTNGYGVRTITHDLAKRVLFSRLEYPENAANVLSIPEKDEFLASMLTRVSSWKETKEVSGVQD